ncbi:MAG TPA: transporter [Candidatus Kapabacteria bacterium]|nr:transporter [Candidatus Kapabacteria bacterium]
MKIRIAICCFVVAFAATTMYAQTPTDAFMMPPGQICLAALYSNSSWSQYWQGTQKLTNGNVGTLTTQTITPMFALGVIDNVNVLAGINYISSQPSSGTLIGTAGWQDAGVWVKYEPLNRTFGPGTIHGLATFGFSAPVGNYVPEYPYSIGLGCTNTSLTGILEYDHESGVYVRGYAGYNERGITTISEDYYFTTQQYYSNQVIIPEALNYAFTAGYRPANGQWFAEAFYNGQHTNGGFDIRPWQAPFPSNQMNYSLIGADGHYFPPVLKGLGVLAEVSDVIDGRNVGQSFTVTGGLTYQFGIWGNN